jgi:hypothetical protein
MEATKEKHATFTPGPWYAHGTRISTWETQDEIEFHGDEVIAETGFDANARLIAAAPELLEQCREFEKCLTFYHGTNENTAISTLANENRDKLREVIAKVDGGEG